MKEVVGTFTQQQIGPTYFHGSNPIDGVWVTLDLTVVHACVMPAGYSIGNHCLLVVDFRTEDILGKSPPMAVQAASRRLNTRIPHTANKTQRSWKSKSYPTTSYKG
jgi:hypothetical protein